ncbi:hypothetical protein OS965_40580 [Streptomyces sp. H27-G5]|uniref:hypothetical protein n=1 Tax=Streptomyces sp. H27-G5 TaxID=2996698 RepID=UPI00226E6B4B|nr:hypothetical protein [Streptomyces sp. H27-G5]MCY0924320.1 hypothetical protein [Streptomyces sp. H27-G5]
MRLHVLILALATVGLRISPNTDNVPVLSPLIGIATAITILLCIAALSIAPQALPLSMLSSGLLFTTCATIPYFTQHHPTPQFPLLSCAALGILGFLQLHHKPTTSKNSTHPYTHTQPPQPTTNPTPIFYTVKIGDSGRVASSM